MPLTFPAHQAFVVPLKRRWPDRFDGVALVVSAGVPDLGYAITGLPVSSHSPAGVLFFALPVTLAYSFILRRWGAPGLVRFVPARSVWARYASVRRRPPALRVMIGSILLGAGSHVAIDSFTHRENRGSRILGFDTVLFTVPVGDVTTAKLLQYTGHTVGSVVAVVLLWRLAQERPPSRREAEGNRRPDVLATWVAVAVLAVGLFLTVLWSEWSQAGPVFVFGCGLALSLLAVSVVTEWVTGRVEPTEG